MKLADYLALLDDAEQSLSDAFTLLATRHSADGDIRDTALTLATWSTDKRLSLRPALDTYGRAHSRDTKRLHGELFRPRPGGFGLVRDLHDASLLAHHAFLCWTAVEHAAEALFDKPLVDLSKRQITLTERQSRWLRTVFKVSTPQALTIVPEKASELRATLQSMKPRLALAGALAGAATLAVAGVALLARRAWR